MRLKRNDPGFCGEQEFHGVGTRVHPDPDVDLFVEFLVPLFALKVAFLIMAKAFDAAADQIRVVVVAAHKLTL